MLVGLSGEANQVVGIVVARYLSLVPMWLEERKCLFVGGVEEVAEGKDLDMDWINLERNCQVQTKTLFRTVWFYKIWNESTVEGQK